MTPTKSLLRGIPLRFHPSAAAATRHLLLPPHHAAAAATVTFSARTSIRRQQSTAATSSAPDDSYDMSHPPTDTDSTSSTTTATSPLYRRNPAQSTNPNTGNALSYHTLKRRSAPAKPWSISPTELHHIHHPFPTAVSRKLPLAERTHKPAHLLKVLSAEERDRVVYEFPRYIEPFQAGDQILLTMYLSLYKNKFERTTGTVLARSGGNSLNAHFTMICVKEDTDYELRLPIHSPWIREIIVIKASERHPRKKMWYIKELDREEYEVKMPKQIGFSEEEELDRKEAARKLQQQQAKRRK